MIFERLGSLPPMMKVNADDIRGFSFVPVLFLVLQKLAPTPVPMNGENSILVVPIPKKYSSFWSPAIVDFWAKRDEPQTSKIRVIFIFLNMCLKSATRVVLIPNKVKKTDTVTR